MEELKLKEVTAKSSRDIIVKPIITEKSMDNAADNKYTFRVAKDANKREIRMAVEDIFKVKVTKITTINLKGKKRMRFDKKGRHLGYTNDWKKAVVTLKTGDKIELAGYNPFEA
jgi:large subunit ribosomal protein L23